MVLALVEGDQTSGWPAELRSQLLRVLVRWGGVRGDALVVKQMTAANPLRRKKIEERRQEFFDAVQRAGGMPAKRLLETCLQQP